MKKFIIICFLMLLTGCSFINTVDEETYEAIKLGIETYNDELQNYWECDKSLSCRTKNTKKMKLENMKNAFKKLKIKK